MASIGEVLREEAHRRLLAKFPIKDWRLESEPDTPVDPEPFNFHVEATEYRLNITIKDGDEEVAVLWMEIEDGEVRVHAYDPAHDEPVNLTISRTDVAIDTHDRDLSR